MSFGVKRRSEKASTVVPPQYMAKRGHKAYAKDRKNSRKPCKIDHDDCEPFIQWMVERVRLECWSLDACVGYARLNKLFTPEQIPYTKTLYNMLWANKLPLLLFDVLASLETQTPP